MDIPVVLGLKLRATKVNSCGLPIEGAANRIVTDAFVRVNLDPEMRARQDLEQTNAQGQVCISESIPAERKWYNTEIQLCNYDPDFLSLVASWARVLDYNSKPIGFIDRAKVDGDYGVAFEVWTGGSGDDDCPIPEDDSIFSAPSSGKKYGYLLFMGKEFVSNALTVEAQPSTLTLTGRTFEPKQWGRGPYNVAGIDAAGTPGRLLVPAYSPADENHIKFFRTPVPPPEATDGAVELKVQSLFVAPDTYFGATAADVAPAQPVPTP